MRKECPVCEIGKLHHQIEMVEVSYKGYSGEIKSHYSVCDYCEADIATSEQVTLNAFLMTDYKKTIDYELGII